MEPWCEAGRRVGAAANPTVSPAGYLDGDMDSKGRRSSPSVGADARALPGRCSFVRGWVRGWARGPLPPASVSCPASLIPTPALSSSVCLSQAPAIEENLLADKHLLKPWDAKKVGVAHRPFPFRGQVSRDLRQPCPHSPRGPFSPQLSSSSSRPRSCEVPGIKYVPV